MKTLKKCYPICLEELLKLLVGFVEYRIKIIIYILYININRHKNSHSQWTSKPKYVNYLGVMQKTEIIWVGEVEYSPEESKKERHNIWKKKSLKVHSCPYFPKLMYKFNKLYGKNINDELFFIMWPNASVVYLRQ